MNTATGHYSIVQYCPDPSRLEAANVGVVLFCQELHYLGVRTARGDGRIRRFFGSKGLDRERLHSTKLSIQRRLMIDRDQFTTLAALEQFAATRVNAMRLTPFRMMVVPVDAPEAELNRLFDRLVGGRAHGDEAPRKSALERASSARALAPLVRRNVTVTLPAFDMRVTVPYGLKNGRFNLIQPARFRNLAPSAILARAGCFAVEGDLL